MTSFRWARTSRPSRQGLYEDNKYPEDKTEKDNELHVAAANRRHQQDFLKAIAAVQAGRRHRRGTHLVGQLHPGELSLQLGRSLTGTPRSSGSSATSKPTSCCAGLSPTVGAPGTDLSRAYCAIFTIYGSLTPRRNARLAPCGKKALQLAQGAK